MALESLVQTVNTAVTDISREVEGVVTEGTSAVIGVLPTVLSLLAALEEHVGALHALDSGLQAVGAPVAPPGS